MNLSEYLRSLENVDIDDIRSDLGPRGIQVSYEPTIKTEKSGRYVISTRRYKKVANFNDKLTRQCGGVVVEYNTNKILAFPPKPCNPRRNFKNVDLTQYDVYQINDGTTVTLYHYDDKWQVSSLNGYSVGALVWAGTKTFKQVLTECLATCADFSWDRLDTNKCYTVGFRHPEYHPFNPNKKVWFIQSVDLSSQNVDEFIPNYEDDIGIPFQTKVDMTIKTLIENVQNAGFNYIRDGTIDMGYILRPNSDNDIEHILLESSLLKYIKKFVYNDRSGRLNPREENYVGANNRMIYIALKSYLDVNDHYVFKSLFSQHVDLYDLFNEFIEKLMDALLGEENEYTKFATTVMRPYLIKEHKLKPRPDMRRSILKDFLIDGVFLDEYYNLMQNQF